MKMLYSKPSWSTQALTDLLAPVAKFQIRGEKLILACPFACLAANIRSKARGVPPSVVNMCEEMLAMDVKAFEEAGGVCVQMHAGDCLWIPDCHLVCEFNMEKHEISTSLSWIAMTKFHCSEECVKFVCNSVKSILQNTCQPSQKSMETHFQVWGCFEKMFQGSVVRRGCNGWLW